MIKIVHYSTRLLILTFFIYGLFMLSKEVMSRHSNSTTTPPVTAAERDRQLDCLVKNIYYEAGTEPFEGKIAVAQVTINRVNSAKYPNDICRVVFQKNIFYDKVVCQFSWYCEKGNKPVSTDNENYRESVVAAKKVLLEDYRLPSLTNALYYHADYTNPNWDLPKIIKIGRHIFYGDKV